MSEKPYFQNPVDRLRERVVRGISTVAALHIVGKIFDIVLIVVLARLLSPTDFGVAAATLIAVELSKLLFDGIGSSVVQLPDISRDEVVSANTLALLLGITLSTLAILFAPLASALLSISQVSHTLSTIAVVFVCQAVALVPEALLARRMRAQRIALAQLAGKIVGGSLGIAIAIHNATYMALIIAACSEYATRACVVLTFERPPLRFGVDLANLRRLSVRASAYLGSSILYFIAVQGDNFLAGRYSGPAALGIYSRAYRLMCIPSDLYSAIADRFVFPAFAALHQDSAALKRSFLSALSLAAVVGLPMSMALWLLSPEIVLLALGPSWNSVAVPFSILMLSSYFRLGAKVCNSLLRAIAAFRPSLIIHALYAALVIVGGAYATQHGGIVLLAAAVSIAVGLYFVAAAFAAATRVGITLLEVCRAQLPGAILCAVVAASLGIFVPLAREQTDRAELVLLAAMAALFPIGLVLFLWRPTIVLTQAGRELLDRIAPIRRR